MFKKSLSLFLLLFLINCGGGGGGGDDSGGTGPNNDPPVASFSASPLSGAAPLAVNFTQAAGPALNDLIKAKSAGQLGEMIGIDIIVTYPKWPREWQKEADWLRFNITVALVKLPASATA